jgi:hypothetical protein
MRPLVNVGGLKLLVHKKLIWLSTQQIRASFNSCVLRSCLPVGRLSAIVDESLANSHDSDESVDVGGLLINPLNDSNESVEVEEPACEVLT